MKVRKINIGRFYVGLIGLDEALNTVKKLNLQSDEEIADRLLDLIKKENYIPEQAEGDYSRALLREYKRFLGIPVEQDTDITDSIKVLGPGCYACEKMEKDIREILAEEGLEVELEHIRDLKEIARFGMLGTPSLVINGKVVLNGRSLPKKKMRELIIRELSKKKNTE